MPCANNGTCLFDFASGILTCVCPEGVTGDFCEITTPGMMLKVPLLNQRLPDSI